MRITKPQKFILFVLGKTYEKMNQKFIDEPIEISISKSAFIDLAKKANLTSKKVRSLYKNLEVLEQNKLIKYNNRTLSLTEKGRKIYKNIDYNLSPFLDVLEVINSSDILKFATKARTILKQN